MATKKYDLAVKVDTYTDRNGEQKNRYQNVGAVIEGERGPYLLLDRYFNPAGVPNPDNRPNVIVSMFEPRDRDGGPAKTDPAPAGGNDHIPF